MTTTCSIVRRVTTVFCLSGALLLTASPSFAQSSESASPNGLAGVWFVQVTLRNCDTNAPLGSFNSLVTFHRGGTVSESTASPGFAIGQRGPGTGTWEAAGHHTYAQRMAALITFDSAAEPAEYAGIQSSAADLARLLRRLVHGDTHARDERRQSRDVVGYERVLQGRRDALSDGMFDGGISTLRVRTSSGATRVAPTPTSRVRLPGPAACCESRQSATPRLRGPSRRWTTSGDRRPRHR